MTRITAIAIMLPALIVAAISTAQAQEGRTVIRPTDFSCGRWVNTPKDTPNYERLRQWVLGYLSGANIESGGADFLQDRDADGLTAWIDNYCRRNSLHAITQALFQLVQELRAGR
jgi:hypothetical protein